MWSLLVGLIGVAAFIIAVARPRRRAEHKRIEAGSRSEEWIRATTSALFRRRAGRLELDVSCADPIA